MTDPQRRRREQCAHRRIDRRVVAGVRRQRVRPEQGGDEFRVGDLLDDGSDHPAGRLVDLLVGPGRVLAAVAVGEAVVLAHEHGLEGGQGDVLAGPHVPGGEQGVGRPNALVVVGERSVREVREAVKR